MLALGLSLLSLLGPGDAMDTHSKPDLPKVTMLAGVPFLPKTVIPHITEPVAIGVSFDDLKEMGRPLATNSVLSIEDGCTGCFLDWSFDQGTYTGGPNTHLSGLSYTFSLTMGGTTGVVATVTDIETISDTSGICRWNTDILDCETPFDGCSGVVRFTIQLTNATHNVDLGYLELGQAYTGMSINSVNVVGGKVLATITFSADDCDTSVFGSLVFDVTFVGSPESYRADELLKFSFSCTVCDDGE
jgi:hypothetical protein